MPPRLSRRAALLLPLAARRVVFGVAPLAGLLAAPALAQPGFPQRPLRLVIPFSSGGGMLDSSGRILAPRLALALGQPVVPENRPGAGGTIGADLVAKAEPDGHTILLTSLSVAAFSPAMFRLPYAADSLTGIGLCGRTALVMVVPADGPTSFTSLLEAARQRPGALNYGSSGNGTPSHVAMELVKRATGTDMAQVPFRGSSQVATEMLAGRIDAAFDSPPAFLGFAREGKLRLLAVSSAERWFATLETPTLAEAGMPGFAAYNWLALQVPARTPAPIRAQLAAALAATLADPEVAGRFRMLGLEPTASSPEELDALVASEAARWGAVIRDANIRLG
jgi:tripartite-type tricarboxylate transporter receptor subunit TctC